MGYVSGIKSTAKIIFRKVRGRIIPISSERISKTSLKMRKHLRRSPKLIGEKRLVAKKLRRIKTAKSIRKIRNVGFVVGGASAASTFWGYKQGKTFYTER